TGLHRNRTQDGAGVPTCLYAEISAGQNQLTNAVHVTVARLQFLLNVKGPIWAAARDGERLAKNPMKVFIIGAGFTKALYPGAPLNRDLLGVLARGATDSASNKLIERYHTGDIEIALTKLDTDIASSETSPKRPDNEVCELRRQVETDFGKYFESYRASDDLLRSLPWA